MKKRIVYALMLVMHGAIIQATQLIQGNVKPTVVANGCPTNPTTTFSSPVNATAYDRANGIFWVGLADSAAEYAISSFQRTLDSGQIPQFKPHAGPATSILYNHPVALLTMATDAGDTCSRVAGVLEDEPTRVILVTLQNNTTQSDVLKAYNPTLNEDGDDTRGIVAIAANRCYIFAAVKSSSLGDFGARNSGIAIVAINQQTLALEQTAAVPGDSGIKAQQLDNFSPFIRINGDSINRHPNITDNRAVLVWDDQLQRLYTGVSLESDAAQQAGDGLRSIVLAQVGCCPEKGELPLFDFAPETAFTTSEDNLVGVALAVNGQNLALTVQKMAIMHASTGPSYLILNGGNGTATNQIFALPLVDLCDPSNNNQGKLADKNTFNPTTHRFEQPAVVNADLTTSGDMFAQVGAGPLPIEPTQTISDMMVIGDAVYVSFKIPQNDTNETGILYSQALFDDEGQIKSWTPWTKRVWPICGFPDSPSSSQVSFFAVDAVTGKVIAIDSTRETVRITEWDEGGTCYNPCQINCSLAAVINKSLCAGSYSVLDLDQSTSGIGESIAYRYALFGGTNKVDFALVSVSRAPSAPFNINFVTGIPYPQLVTVDYCCPDSFKETCLPTGAGCVTSLEYARRLVSQGNTNYFFAGTQKGLFAFANQGGLGFAVTDLGLLNAGIIAQGSWQFIPGITGAVVDIKTSGNALYVLTFQTSCEKPLFSRVQRIDFEDNLTAMFNLNTNVFTIAESGSDSGSPALASTLLFTAIDIIQTTEDGSEEQLVLATNNGIFQSQAVGGIQNVTNQTAAAWTNLQSNTLFYGIGSVDNARIKSTDWPFSAQDPCGCKTFERSSIHQLNGDTTTADFEFVPTFFNHNIPCVGPCPSECNQESLCIENSTTPCQQAQEVCSAFCDPNCCLRTDISNSACTQCKLFEKICYFWSDGGRRFFIIAPTNSKIACIPCCGKKRCCCCPLEQLRFLEVTPFDTCVWNVCDPLQTVLKDCVLRNIPAYYWVRPIGMTGIIMSGTPSGVVALE